MDRFRIPPYSIFFASIVAPPCLWMAFSTLPSSSTTNLISAATTFQKNSSRLGEDLEFGLAGHLREQLAFSLRTVSTPSPGYSYLPT